VTEVCTNEIDVDGATHEDSLARKLQVFCREWKGASKEASATRAKDETQ
jgi:hypothetical protein